MISFAKRLKIQKAIVVLLNIENPLNTINKRALDNNNNNNSFFFKT